VEGLLGDAVARDFVDGAAGVRASRPVCAGYGAEELQAEKYSERRKWSQAISLFSEGQRQGKDRGSAANLYS